MAFLLGGSFVSSIVSKEVYDPVFDTELDSTFIYNTLPSFYRDIMQDKDVFSETWTGVLQFLTGQLLLLWQNDYAKSLRDVPVLSQRKWVWFDLKRSEDFVDDPILEINGTPGLFTHDLSGVLTCSPKNRTRWDRASLPLRSGLLGDTVDQDTSLLWSVSLSVTSIESRGAVLYGYMGTPDDFLSNSLLLGILGSEVGDGRPVAVILQASPTGLLAAAVDSLELQLGAPYRLDGTYTARTGNVVLSVVSMEYEKGAGNGATSSSTSGGWTATFTDVGVDFSALGVVVGDKLLVAGQVFAIGSVSGSVLTVTPPSLPADIVDLPYTVVGEHEVSSISLNLPAGTTDPTFNAGRFGACSLDTRKLSSQIFGTPSLAARKGAVISVSSWSYTDPTSADVLLSLPRLQDNIVSPTSLLYEGTDYEIALLDQGLVDLSASTIKFQEPPKLSMWAEYAAYDAEHIYNNFGSNVGIRELSSDRYKARVRGLYYSYFQGPTVSSMRTGVHILVGLPIADEAGTVTAVNPTLSGVFGQIVVGTKGYLYPAITGTSLQVGDEVAAFQPLSNGVEVVDYITDPEWFVSSGVADDLGKFHSFQVLLDLDAFSLDTLGLAATFVEQIKPTWKSHVFTVFKRLTEEVTVTDVLTFSSTIEIVDTMCDVALVAYDDSYMEGAEPNWRYDQGVTPWDSTSAAMRATSTSLTGVAYLVNGNVQVAGAATQQGPPVWNTDIGVGPTPSTYVAYGAYSEGTSGETSANLPALVDNTPYAFDRILPTDRVDIAGEGTFEVNTVDRNDIAVGIAGEFDTTTSFHDPAATWLTAGVQVGDILVPLSGKNLGSEFLVTAVIGETDLVLATPGLPALISSGSGGFSASTVFTEATATWVADGVQAGDILVIGGAGPNGGASFEVGVVLNDTTLTVLGTALVSAGEAYTIKRVDSFAVRRLNQLTLNSPTSSTTSGVLWNSTGTLTTWAKVSSVTSDTLMDMTTPFTGVTGNYVVALIDNRYLKAYHDSFDELCPDEAFTLILTYTNGVAPGVTQVPSADPLLSTTYNFAVVGDAYTVTLAEPVP